MFSKSSIKDNERTKEIDESANQSFFARLKQTSNDEISLLIPNKDSRDSNRDSKHNSPDDCFRKIINLNNERPRLSIQTNSKTCKTVNFLRLNPFTLKGFPIDE